MTGVFSARSGVKRAWTASNDLFAPDCDLLTAAAANLTTSVGDLCGNISNLVFGTRD